MLLTAALLLPSRLLLVNEHSFEKYCISKLWFDGGDASNVVPTTSSFVFPGMFSFTRRKRHTPLPNVPSLAKQHLRKYIPSMEHLEPVASGRVVHPELLRVEIWLLLCFSMFFSWKRSWFKTTTTSWSQLYENIHKTKPWRWKKHLKKKTQKTWKGQNTRHLFVGIFSTARRPWAAQSGCRRCPRKHSRCDGKSSRSTLQSCWGVAEGIGIQAFGGKS